MGNQAALRLLSQRGFTPTEKEAGGGHGQEAEPANRTPRGTPGVSWDFSKIPVFPPDQSTRCRSLSPLITPSLPAVIQTKLAIGQVDDPLEHEADQVADQVMRMADPGVSVTAAPAPVNRKCAACEEEDAGKLRTKRASPPESTPGQAPGSVHEALRAPGRPLDASARAFFEPRFGRDFSAVRVHADALAARSAREIGACAYTVGNQIVFADGAFAPRASGRAPTPRP